MSKPITDVRITGTIAGKIWMPAATCGKQFDVRRSQYPFSSYVDENGQSVRATLRDMILHVTNDGDFQSAQVIDATVTFERSTFENNRTRIERRHYDIRRFPSVADMVAEEDSQEYWDGVDCFAEVE